MSVIQHHKTEAAKWALKYHKLHCQRETIDKQMEDIDLRLRELDVIIQTAEHGEAEKAQALKEQREALATEPYKETTGDE